MLIRVHERDSWASPRRKVRLTRERSPSISASRHGAEIQRYRVGADQADRWRRRPFVAVVAADRVHPQAKGQAVLTFAIAIVTQHNERFRR